MVKFENEIRGDPLDRGSTYAGVAYDLVKVYVLHVTYLHNHVTFLPYS